MNMNGGIVKVGAVAAVAAARSSLANPSFGAAMVVTGRRGLTTFEQREKGEESVYMRREDQKLLHSILVKERAASAAAKDEKAALKAILGTNELSSEVIDKLLAWKSS